MKTWITGGAFFVAMALVALPLKADDNRTHDEPVTSCTVSVVGKNSDQRVDIFRTREVIPPRFIAEKNKAGRARRFSVSFSLGKNDELRINVNDWDRTVNHGTFSTAELIASTTAPATSYVFLQTGDENGEEPALKVYCNPASVFELLGR